MKDAKGHGSDAHATGVSQIGKQAKSYYWTKDSHGIHRLTGDPNVNIMTQIGSVIPQRDSAGKPTYRADYSYPHSTGNAQIGFSIHKSSQGAKKYIEDNLAKFWEPPKVVK